MSSVQFDRFKDLGVIPFDLRNPVFKYRNFEQAQEIIKSNKIYFPTSNELNDKLELHQSLFDLSFTTETKLKFYERVLNRKLHPSEIISDEQFSEFLLQSIETLKATVGILSTGRFANNSFLWDQYGDNHKGVCLGLKIPEHALSTHLSFQINYTENPLKIKYIDDNTYGLTKDIFYCLCTKHKSYISEDEVRILSENHHGLTPFDKAMLYEIVFGKDSTTVEKKAIFELVKREKYMVERFGQIAIDNSHFGLKIEYFDPNSI